MCMCICVYVYVQVLSPNKSKALRVISGATFTSVIKVTNFKTKSSQIFLPEDVDNNEVVSG